MHIVADAKIPDIAAALSRFGTVELYDPPNPPTGALARAQALIVRSVTRIDSELLTRSPNLRFVGSATAGTDHVARESLSKRGVHFGHAPGANARSVVEYVVAALAVARVRPPAVVGVVGFGQVGRRATSLLRALGYCVLVTDPPLDRQRRGSGAGSTEMVRRASYLELMEVARRADVLSCHVPLVTEGPDATRHLLNGRVLDALGSGLVINTARGGVVDEMALVARAGVRAVLDVWEEEPELPGSLLQKLGPRLLMATPHIAGYTREAKRRCTLAICEALGRYLGRATDWDGGLSPASDISLSPGDTLADALERVRGLVALDRALRAQAGRGGGRGAFEALRRVSGRREVAAHRFEGGSPEVRAALCAIQGASEASFESRGRHTD